ncbi:hypothetical protein HXX76_002099 [Chlamydomonas incerta]|uniref:Protein kinase domain-containing protein n=1 Tax=Chlamydomonas incerta TaxID=51695 RepID=A0A836B0I1_CHLIN|nr:hypothetical protein HXX76_002099 [Chlamydomonas incerta]|eukprot:KAG2443753.1 hypothetical protein HXX76_002099 [Chlamydomonas incerta]
MALGAAITAGGGNGSSTVVTPAGPAAAAQLTDVRLTCPAAAGSGGATSASGPVTGWACNAVTLGTGGVSGSTDSSSSRDAAAELTVIAPGLLRAMEAGGIVMITFPPGLTSLADVVASGAWQSLDVQLDRTLALFGRGRNDTQLDLAGLQYKGFVGVAANYDSQQGLVRLYDMSLLGLSYPLAVDDLSLLAGWAHALQPYEIYRTVDFFQRSFNTMIQFYHVRMLVPDDEVAWWRNAAAPAAGGANAILAGRGWVGPRPVESAAVLEGGGVWWYGPGLDSTAARASAPGDVGPMHWGARGMWGFTHCWVAGLSSLAAAAASQPALAAAVAAAPQQWPLAEQLGAAEATKLELKRLGFTGGFSADPVFELAYICGGGRVTSDVDNDRANGPIDIVLAPAAGEQWAPYVLDYVQPYLRRTNRMGVTMMFMQLLPSANQGWTPKGYMPPPPYTVPLAFDPLLPPSAPAAPRTCVLRSPPRRQAAAGAVTLSYFKFGRFTTLAENVMKAPRNASQLNATASAASPLQPPPLTLANCSLVVPPPELELLRGLLREAGRLPEPGSSNSSSSSRRRQVLADVAPGGGNGSSGSRPYPLVSWPPGIDPSNSSRLLGVAACPRAVLLAYAAVAEVEAEGADSISFKQIAFMGWFGWDVVITTRLKDNTPSGPLDSPEQYTTRLYAPELDLPCPTPPPAPQPPSRLPQTPPSAASPQPQPPPRQPLGRGGGGRDAAGGGLVTGAPPQSQPAVLTGAAASTGDSSAAAVVSAAAAPADGAGGSVSAFAVPKDDSNGASSGGDGDGSQPDWVVPVAATLAAVGGAAILAAAAAAVVLKRRRLGQQHASPDTSTGAAKESAPETNVSPGGKLGMSPRGGGRAGGRKLGGVLPGLAFPFAISTWRSSNNSSKKYRTGAGSSAVGSGGDSRFGGSTALNTGDITMTGSSALHASGVAAAMARAAGTTGGSSENCSFPTTGCGLSTTTPSGSAAGSDLRAACAVAGGGAESRNAAAAGSKASDAGADDSAVMSGGSSSGNAALHGGRWTVTVREGEASTPAVPVDAAAAVSSMRRWPGAAAAAAAAGAAASGATAAAAGGPTNPATAEAATATSGGRWRWRQPQLNTSLILLQPMSASDSSSSRAGGNPPAAAAAPGDGGAQPAEAQVVGSAVGASAAVGSGAGEGGRVLILGQARRVNELASSMGLHRRGRNPNDNVPTLSATRFINEGGGAAPGDAADDVISERLYLECVIGRGSFGVVYKGTWRGLHVAVKTLVVHDALVGGAEGRRRKRAVLEAAVSLSLFHSCVVQTYAYEVRRLGEVQTLLQTQQQRESNVPRPGSSQPPTLVAVEEEQEHQPHHADDEDPVHQLLLIQAFCEGGSLREGIETGRLLCGLAPDSPSAVLLGLYLALDVAAGMAHVHARGIVHGDLSSGNVLLSERPSPEEEDQLEQQALQAAAAEVRAQAEAEQVRNALGISAAAVVATAPTEHAEGASGIEECEAVAAETAVRRRVGAVWRPEIMAKVADFGLSERMREGQTHASNCWQGTPAYTAPEVMYEGHMRKVSDVYSYGMVLLELMTGLPAHNLMVVLQEGSSNGFNSTRAAGAGTRATAQLVPPGVVTVIEVLLPPAVTSSGREDLVGLLSCCLAPNPQHRPTFPKILGHLADIIVTLAGGADTD